MRKILTVVATISAFIIASSAADKAKVGRTLPQWTKGTLDIHFITTGRGECYFCIFPDGTSMLVDAGEFKSGNGHVPPVPDSQTRATSVYVRYLKHFLAATGDDGKLDYVLLSHFHNDHMGSSNCSESDEHGFKHIGLIAVCDSFKVGTIIDRGWPLYGRDTTYFFNPVPGRGMTSREVSEWEKFVEYQNSIGTDIQRFEVGSDTQVSMRNGGRFDFSVLNICGNAKCLTKDSATGMPKVINAKGGESENNYSLGYHLKYGNFDFIACGDLSGNPQNQFAKSYINVFKPSVEVFKTNHHLHFNSWGSGMTSVGFQPRVTMVQSFHLANEKHLTPAVVDKVTTFSDVYVSSIHPDSLKEYPETFSKVKDHDGHFVVRVQKNGEFIVYKLDYLSGDYTVQAIHGPYKSER